MKIKQINGKLYNIYHDMKEQQQYFKYQQYNNKIQPADYSKQRRAAWLNKRPDVSVHTAGLERRSWHDDLSYR